MAIEKKLIDYIPIVGAYTFYKRNKFNVEDNHLIEDVKRLMDHSVYQGAVSASAVLGSLGLAALLIK
jgi:hypothetical protein